MSVCLKILQKHFLERKGSDLWSAICEDNAHRVPSPCQIKLAKSEVDRDCMLLILVGERGQLSSFLWLSLILLHSDLDVGSGSGDCLWGEAVGHKSSVTAWRRPLCSYCSSCWGLARSMGPWRCLQGREGAHSSSGFVNGRTLQCWCELQPVPLCNVLLLF